MHRKTKIVATIGPASQSEIVIRSLIEAGMNVARLNFSHGEYDIHSKIFHQIRGLSKSMGMPVSILQDLQGPKIRTGLISGGHVALQQGQTYHLTVEPVIGNLEKVSVDFANFLDYLCIGSTILLDDGNLELKVAKIGQNSVETRVVIGGKLESHKGVNLPYIDLDIPGFTEKDHKDLIFGLNLGVDYIAVSFVRSAEDIRKVKEAIAVANPDKSETPVIAKLERPEALRNLDEILNIADGVMVARGDLGVEMSPEQVPIAQKNIIASANRSACIVITATQMLESMIQKPRPTRAEASDVANAIFDGTDAVMLSGETAVGLYPQLAVKMMESIICQAETHLHQWGHVADVDIRKFEQDDTYYVTRAAGELAYDRNVAAIAVFTQSGRTARLMSKVRSTVPIVAFTPSERTFERLGMLWGVIPFKVPYVNTIEEVLSEVEKMVISSKLVQPGQQIVLICGFPIQAMRQTNLALLHTIKT
jgi:pyruvate kinase